VYSASDPKQSCSLVALSLVVLIFLAGCEAQEPSLPVDTPQQNGSVDSADTSPSDPSNSTTAKPRIVAFGNSLTAGLGVPPDQSYPAHLQRQLQKAGYQYEVINAGVSGDTTAGGLRRVDWVLKSRPSIVIVELGANDALRGQSLASMHSNLDKILTRFRNAETQVVLAGMKIPPNYGVDYTTNFASMFEKLARKHEIPLIPFLLDGVAAQPELNQADGIHPTAAGYKIVAQTVLQVLKPILKNNQIS